MIVSWADYFQQVSQRSDQKYWFSIKGQFLNVSCFFSSDFIYQSQFDLHHILFFVATFCDCIWLLQLKISSNRSVGGWFYSTPREVREKWPRTPTVRSTTTIVAHWTLIQNLTKKWFKNCSKIILSPRILFDWSIDF